MIVRPSIVYGFVACLFLALLTACVAPDPPAPTLPAPTLSSSGSEVGESVTLVLWHGWFGSRRQALTRLVDDFNKQHPQGRVLLQSTPMVSFAGELRAAAAAGGGPHIVLIPNSWVGGLAAAGVLLPIEDLVSPAEREALLPVTLSGAQAYDSAGAQHLYGIPITFDTLALYYNTANVQLAPADTTSLIDIAHGLGDATGSPPRWGLALNLSLDNTIGYLYAFDGRIFDNEGRLVLGSTGRAGAEQWLNWLVKLHNDQQLLARSGSSISIDRELKNGRVLMTFDWAHKIGDYRRLWGEHMGVAPLPRLNDTDQVPRSYVQGELLAINGRVGPGERQAALEFVRYMSSEAAQRELLVYDIQPARRALALPDDEAHAAARAFRAQAEQGVPMLNGPERDIIWQTLKIMQQSVLMGQSSPADAVTEADARLREMLQLPPR